mmetsp:Transcript_69828/g.195228  ORF Transcript_69828/g.195228 Transcript_69828/m.195228 type:complete len:356 (-) Transcript_69828:319-1386(-)
MNIYSYKTKLGNWVEEEYAPGSSASAFSSARFLTTSMSQQYETTGAPAKLGRALPASAAGQFNYDIICPDTDASPKNWASVSNSMHRPPSESAPTEFSTNFKLRGGFKTREAVQQYRDAWTKDSPLGRSRRFMTTNNLGPGAGTRYQTKQLRALPGAPMAVEQLREKIHRQAGSLGLVELRSTFASFFHTPSDSRLSRVELRQGLEKMGVVVPTADLDRCVAHFDQSGDGLVDAKEFIAGMRGEISESRRQSIREAFEILDVHKDGVIAVQDLKGRYTVAGEEGATEEVALQKFLAQWDCYTVHGVVSEHSFANYYCDISALVEDDQYFTWLVRSVWGLVGSGQGTELFQFKQEK